MARRRQASCPAGHTWETRANPRVRLRCPECRDAVLAPPIDDPWRGPPPARPEPVIEHATRTVARRTTPRVTPAPAERPDEALTPAQQAGRRGGLGQGLSRRMGRS